MMFSLGIAAYGVAKILDGETWRGLIVCGTGLWLAGMVRPHMAALVAVSLAAAVVTRKSKDGAAGARADREGGLDRRRRGARGGAGRPHRPVPAGVGDRHEPGSHSALDGHPEPHVRRRLVVRSLDRGFPGARPARGDHRAVPPLRLRDPQPPVAPRGDRGHRVDGASACSGSAGDGRRCGRSDGSRTSCSAWSSPSCSSSRTRASRTSASWPASACSSTRCSWSSSRSRLCPGARRPADARGAFRARGTLVTAVARKASKVAVTLLGMPARRRPGDVVVLLYHRVGDGPVRDRAAGRVFERQLDELVADGARPDAGRSARRRHAVGSW